MKHCIFLLPQDVYLVRFSSFLYLYIQVKNGKDNFFFVKLGNCLRAIVLLKCLPAKGNVKRKIVTNCKNHNECDTF